MTGCQRCDMILSLRLRYLSTSWQKGWLNVSTTVKWKDQIASTETTGLVKTLIDFSCFQHGCISFVLRLLLVCPSRFCEVGGEDRECGEMKRWLQYSVHTLANDRRIACRGARQTGAADRWTDWRRLGRPKAITISKKQHIITQASQITMAAVRRIAAVEVSSY